VRQYQKLIFLVQCLYVLIKMKTCSCKYSIFCTDCLVVFDVDVNSVVIQPVSSCVMMCE
jgi:hypothetical protein